MKKLNLVLFFIFYFLFFTVVSGESTKLLRPEEAFIPEVVKVTSKQIVVKINIAKNHYIYRERAMSLKPKSNLFTIKNFSLSAGEIKSDKYFGKQSVWYGSNEPAFITIDYELNKQKGINSNLKPAILLTLQGCKDKSICYPPHEFTLYVNLPVKSKTLLKVEPNTGLFRKPSSSLLLNSKVSNKVLDADDAFSIFLENINNTTFAISWNVALDYYLYRNKIVIKDIENSDSLISNIIIPKGETYEDKFFGVQEIFRGDINGKSKARAVVYFKKPFKDLKLSVSYQGCADRLKICYPIINKTIVISSDKLSSGNIYNSEDSSKFSLWSDLKKSISTGNTDIITNILIKNKLFAIILLFVFGLILTFTPCVMPMIPILIGIIKNQKQLTKIKALIFSTSYVLGMATMIVLVGVSIHLTGINLQVILQKPILLISFSILFLVMSLAMFGLFDFVIPTKFQEKVYSLQNKLQGVKSYQLFLIGAISILVVGPCVAPPLFAVVTFISATSDLKIGSLYLFVFGFGMGFLLIIFSIFSSAIPKAGEFTKLINKFLAMMILGVSLWLVSRLLPGPVNLFIFGLFLLGFAFIFFRAKGLLVSDFSKVIVTIIAVVSLLIGISWVIGGALGNSNAFKPFTKVTSLDFTYINTEDDLLAEVKKANSLGEVAMLDLYADWCVSCKEVEHIIFADNRVRKSLAKVKLLKLDITKTTKEHRIILEKYGLFGPPAILFFKNGKEVKNKQIIGVPEKDYLIKTIELLQ